METMKDLTDEEYNALDEELTRTIPKLGPNGTGFLSRLEARRMGLDNLSVNYLWTKAAADHKTPAQIIGEMVRKEIAVGAEA
ncbi:MAG: hypothetical protein LBF78_03620 [Treponema sp.]|jgi:hypothetical protein|nr:hypothetical protein [Treponema sp.]